MLFVKAFFWRRLTIADKWRIEVRQLRKTVDGLECYQSMLEDKIMELEQKIDRIENYTGGR